MPVVVFDPLGIEQERDSVSDSLLVRCKVIPLVPNAGFAVDLVFLLYTGEHCMDGDFDILLA